MLTLFFLGLNSVPIENDAFVHQAYHTCVSRVVSTSDASHIRAIRTMYTYQAYHTYVPHGCTPPSPPQAPPVPIYFSIGTFKLGGGWGGYIHVVHMYGTLGGYTWYMHLVHIGTRGTHTWLGAFGKCCAGRVQFICWYGWCGLLVGWMCHENKSKANMLPHIGSGKKMAKHWILTTLGEP